VVKIEESKEQMRILSSFLGVSDPPDEQHQKVDGSCQWIDNHLDFQCWRGSNNNVLTKHGAEPASNSPFILWVHANPGTGKTFLAAQVTAELQEAQVECAYYYFHAGDKTSQSLGDFLRSIAYQMAMSNADIREKLAKLWQEKLTFDLDDDQTIWNKVFKRGIFKVSFARLAKLFIA
jgi:chromosomal replication initiation ATPase DnaA